jgi:excinuclease ABC subunit B
LSGTKDRGISYKDLIEYINILGVKLEECSSLIKLISRRKDKLSPYLDINKGLLTFVGLYLAEGHNTGKYIVLSNSNKKLHGVCKSYWKSLGLGYTERDHKDVAYHSTIIANFFKMFGRKAQSKRIPDFVYNLSNKQLGVLLKAMFDGDGWVESNSVQLLSASKELIFDLKNLLLRFDISSRIHIKKNKNYPLAEYYQLSITGGENLKHFNDNISFSIGYKKDKALQTIRPNNNTNVDVIPHSATFFRDLRTKHGMYQRELANHIGSQALMSMVESGQRQLSRQKFMQIMTYLSNKNTQYCKYLNINQFNFRKIISIEQVKSTTGYVYDIAIKDNENFMAGCGNIFVHNTFVMANLIQKVQKPTLIIAHNKILAAQLYTELKELFPKNRVEYFISYYDYYQPESYIPTTDVYIEKEATVNAQIEKMRLHAISSLMSRDDVIIVASISCIYGLGDPQDFKDMSILFEKGKKQSRISIITRLVEMQYERDDNSLEPGKFRARGNVIDIVPGYEDDIIRIELDENSIKNISELNHITGDVITVFDKLTLFPAKQFVVPEEKQKKAIEQIRIELDEHLPSLGLLEAERLRKRVKYDIEMIEEMGYCNGIENYSRHFDGRKIGTPPHVLLDYFPKDFLLIIDESHQSIPQANAMYKGDYSRKKNLVDFGFRLPCAYDNRPLKFSEFEKYFNHVVFASATPSEYEIKSSGQIVNLIIRPTGLLDPIVEMRPIKGQIKDMISEIQKTVDNDQRVLITTLTKRMAEDLTDFLSKEGIKVRYMHSEIESLERIELVRQLRSKDFDVLVGINLLREGLDIPEVALICILDADKEGFLRDERSLIQTIGRAARNVDGKVILYADRLTRSIKSAMKITSDRREAQIEFNRLNHIIPQTIIKKIAAKKYELKGIKHMAKLDIEKKIAELDANMRIAAENLDFEKAIEYRDTLEALKQQLTGVEEQKAFVRGKKK